MTKCAMVTGGSRNIGQGIAVVLAEQGYDIAVTYQTQKDGAEETRRQVEALGRRCFLYEAHLEQPCDPERVIRQAHTDLGRLDVMICNAGIDRRHSILTVTAEELDTLYACNLRSYFLCAGISARLMLQDSIGGSIIMITSVRARLAHPDDFFYGGVKAAMERACQSMALDLSAHGIRVNCIAPGAVWRSRMADSPFASETIPLQRSGTPRDIAEAVAFLAGEKASYITGTTLLVDGGLSLPGLLERNEAIPWKQDDWTSKHYDKAIEMLNEKEGGE